MKEIREIIKTYEETDFTEVSLALATVVNVEESSYRRIGARMLVKSNGQWVGGISGGCLEGDALRRSQTAIFNKTPSKVVYDTMDDEVNQIGVGLGCNGRLEVLFMPIDNEDEDNPIERLKKIVAFDKPVIQITIIESEKDLSKLGTSILTYGDDKTPEFHSLDKIGISEMVKSTFSKRRSQIQEAYTPEGEKVKLLYEFLRPEMKVVIVGDNYDVNALIGIVKELGWEIYVVGQKKKMHRLTLKYVKSIYEYKDFDKVPIDNCTAVLLMTHDYNWDKIIFKKAIQLAPVYIGLLGPKKRFVKMKNEADFDGLTQFDYVLSIKDIHNMMANMSHHIASVVHNPHNY